MPLSLIHIYALKEQNTYLIRCMCKHLKYILLPFSAIPTQVREDLTFILRGPTLIEIFAISWVSFPLQYIKIRPVSVSVTCNQTDNGNE